MNRTAKKELAKRGLRVTKKIDIRADSIFNILAVATEGSDDNGPWRKAKAGEKL